jgi:pimeloyl-ACP methyl ester carboxylesterase
MIRRGFADLEGRQLHYRWGEGESVPMIALHALPGSSRQIQPLLEALTGRRVYAPDMAGTGDSGRHPMAQPGIADYAEDTLAFLDALGLEQVDLYGSHTGSCIAVELANRFPDRVRKIVLDGVALFSPQEGAALAASYAPSIEPDINGLHLLSAHNFCRDQILFWPWHERTAAGSRGTGMPPPRELHDWVLEVIKGLDGFPPAYHAAFTYRMAEKLAGVRHETLCIVAEVDTLAAASSAAVGLLPVGRSASLKGEGTAMAAPAQVAQAIDSFLG